jgi:hypothetical protein
LYISFANRLIATRRAQRWCRALAAYAFLALAWPSLGPLPWMVGHDEAEAHAAQAHEAAARERQEHRHVDVSAIPGTPTHPDDHGCAECQVLKHLARCIPAVPAIDFTVAAVASVVARPFVVELPAPQARTLLPPVRAPPALA